MLVIECKRSITQILNALLSEKGTDPSVLLCILEVVKGWIEDDCSKSASSSPFLTPKEIVSFLQKLSQDKQNFSPSALEEWDWGKSFFSFFMESVRILINYEFICIMCGF